MALLKLQDFDSNYRETLGNDDFSQFDVYSEQNERIGKVADALVDETGHFRYLVVDLESWLFNKQVLLPFGRSQFDYSARCIRIAGLSKTQIKDLPAYRDRMVVDDDYEERVRGAYRSRTLEDSAPLEASAPLDAPIATPRRSNYVDAPVSISSPGTTAIQSSVEPSVADSLPDITTSANIDTVVPASPDPTVVDTFTPASPDIATPDRVDTVPVPVDTTVPASNAAYNRDTYIYQQDATLYELNEQNHKPFIQYQQRVAANRNRAGVEESVNTPLEAPEEVAGEEPFRLLEERLIVNRSKLKVGEVIVRKEIETQIVEVPIRREKLIVEQVSPEHKQLAVIDLGQVETTGIELTDVGTDSGSIVRGEFTSARTASQFLAAIADQSNSACKQVQVKIVLEDAGLQQTYQHLLERYLAIQADQPLES